MKTLKLRIKDKHTNQLNILAGSVNFVWNYVNELSFKHLKRTAYDLAAYTKGAGEYLNLHSQTLQAISEVHAKSRKQFKKAKLNWRTNNPKAKRRNLGWIPFKKTAIKYLATRQSGKKSLKSIIQLSLAKGKKLIIDMWDSYNLALYNINTCELVQDARGHWYACITVKEFPKIKCGDGQVGIDLGCKDAAVSSDGDQLQTKLTHQYAEKLAIAQRAKNKKRVKAIHAKIKNTRKDLTHKFTNKLVKANSLIVVGKIKSTSFTKGKLAKSVYDAGWFEIKRQLDYKCKHAGCHYIEVNEAYSTQTCSCCGSRQDSPKGRAGLGIRVWFCRSCKTTHQRDVNGAKNILAVGLGRLE